jgi:hypothetical protein
MIATLKRILRENRSLHRMSFAVAHAAATAPLRQLNPSKPESWEFSGFSQNGEDGLLDFITTRLLEPNRYFVEIGCSDGLENNTTWLALCRNYSGLMIDGSETQLL